MRRVDNLQGYQANIAHHLDCISRWVVANELEVNWAKIFAIIYRPPIVYRNLALRVIGVNVEIVNKLEMPGDEYRWQVML